MPYADLPAFWARLAGQAGIAAQAVRFAILTAARSGEVRGATWGEVDLTAAVWALPAARMKMGKPHVIPLTAAALAVLGDAAAIRQSDMLFNGAKADAPLSDMSLSAVLKRMKLGHFTVHGFRSTFRTWIAEQTAFPPELAEVALAHSVGSKVEQAYQRGDLLEKRGALMQAWAAFVTGG